MPHSLSHWPARSLKGALTCRRSDYQISSPASAPEWETVVVPALLSPLAVVHAIPDIQKCPRICFGDDFCMSSEIERINEWVRGLRHRALRYGRIYTSAPTSGGTMTLNATAFPYAVIRHLSFSI